MNQIIVMMFRSGGGGDQEKKSKSPLRNERWGDRKATPLPPHQPRNTTWNTIKIINMKLYALTAISAVSVVAPIGRIGEIIRHACQSKV